MGFYCTAKGIGHVYTYIPSCSGFLPHSGHCSFVFNIQTLIIIHFAQRAPPHSFQECCLHTLESNPEILLIITEVSLHIQSSPELLGECLVWDAQKGTKLQIPRILEPHWPSPCTFSEVLSWAPPCAWTYSKAVKQQDTLFFWELTG